MENLPQWTQFVFAYVGIAVLVALPISLGIAHVAGRGARGAWAWGVFGPVGWVIAALVGVQSRLDEIVKLSRRAARDMKRVPPRSLARREGDEE